MEILYYPPRESWAKLLERPAISKRMLESKVREVLEDVRLNGDAALRKYTQLFDGVDLAAFEVRDEELASADAAVPADLKAAIRTAKENIEKFHRAQIEEIRKIETMPGVLCWRESLPIERVGLYIPGGTAPLFSSVLMLAIPAQIAGCPEIVLCTPPDKDAKLNPVILYTAQILGVKRIFKIGGAQAIAALAYGTASIPRVDKIFGPGNQYVTLAKQMVSTEGVAIDMPAGPSEVAVIADDSADPDFVAADLLSQAEHGVDSQVILLTDSEGLLEKVQKAVQVQMNALPRRDIASKALQHSKLVLLFDLDEALEMVNAYAPEHLILMTSNPGSLAERVVNAGSVFVGAYTPESAGDYASGTNHTLPTNGYARNYSGVSVDSFVKKVTFQQISPEGLQNVGPVIEKMARAEGLQAHRNAVSIRLEKLKAGRG